MACAHTIQINSALIHNGISARSMATHQRLHRPAGVRRTRLAMCFQRRFTSGYTHTNTLTADAANGRDEMQLITCLNVVVPRCNAADDADTFAGFGMESSYECMRERETSAPPCTCACEPLSMRTDGSNALSHRPSLVQYKSDTVSVSMSHCNKCICSALAASDTG